MRQAIRKPAGVDLQGATLVVDRSPGLQSDHADFGSVCSDLDRAWVARSWRRPFLISRLIL